MTLRFHHGKLTILKQKAKKPAAFAAGFFVRIIEVRLNGEAGVEHDRSAAFTPLYRPKLKRSGHFTRLVLCDTDAG
jgi:hypothetical protein